MHKTSKTFSWLSATLLVACTAGQPYQKPDIPAPPTWTSPHTDCSTVECKSNDGWWKQLHDETLNTLIDRAIKNNHDLKIAEARITEAKALNDGTFSKLLPDISATASTGLAGDQRSLGGIDKTNGTLQTGLTASWDIDIFGGTRAELEAGTAGIHRTEAEYQAAMLTLIADVARAYTETRTLQQLHSLTSLNLELEQQTLNATRIQYQANAISKLDVLRAEAQVETTQAELPSINSELAASLHRLSVLLGEPPGSLDALLEKPQPVPVFEETIALTTPIAVIAVRPDIQAAEYTLMEKTALKNASTVEMFPKLSLSSFFNVGASSAYGASNPWSVGANALLPLLNFGRIQSDIDAADARKVQAFHAYQQTILKALEEVENALVAYDQEIERQRILETAAATNKEAVRLANIKYQAGDATFLDLLIAEERLLQAQSSALASRSNAAKAAIALHTSLGVSAPHNQ